MKLLFCRSDCKHPVPAKTLGLRKRCRCHRTSRKHRKKRNLDDIVVAGHLNHVQPPESVLLAARVVLSWSASGGGRCTASQNHLDPVKSDTVHQGSAMSTSTAWIAW